MNEFTNSYESLKGSIFRTLIYTVGHVIIATLVVTFVADVSIIVAITDATIEPIINGFWFFTLDRLWNAKGK